VRAATYGSYYDSAAGDFCLLPSRVLHQIRGFAEIPNNIFMDGTAIHAAAAHGFGQQVFKPPCSIYHQVWLPAAATVCMICFFFGSGFRFVTRSQAHPRSFNTKGTLLTFSRFTSPSHTHFL
jgi:hypothetical protein